MIASFKRSLWVGGIAVIAFGAIMGLMTATMSIAHAGGNENNNGTLQPVWCHLTGNGWKAQLGAKPSGERNEAFALMGNFGDGVDENGQTLAHDRSNKLDAACQPPTYQSIVTYGQWNSTPNCTTFMVVSIRTKTVTPQIAQLQDGKWVAVNGTPVVTTETATRPMTDAEIKNCTPEPSKPDKVSVVWTDGEPDCDTLTVPRTGVETTVHYTYTWENSAWVEHPTTTTKDLTDSRAMTSEERAACNEQPGEEGVATATFNILPAYCDAGQTLKYGAIKNAQVNGGSTLDGAMGPKSYSVTVTANPGFLFAADAQGVSNDRMTMTVAGDLAGPLTGEDCVLGEGTTTPGTNGGSSGVTTAPAVAQLPETDGEATTVIAVAGSLFAVVAGFAGIRRFLTRGL